MGIIVKILAFWLSLTVCYGAHYRRDLIAPSAASSSVTPPSSDLKLWLKSESIPAGTNGSQNLLWPDSSVSAWRVTNSTLDTSIVLSNGTVNGYGSVSFKSGAVTGLQITDAGGASVNILSNVTSSTWFFVHRKWTIPSGNIGLAYFRPGVGQVFFRYWLGASSSQGTNLLVGTQRLDAEASDYSTSMNWPVGRWVIVENECYYTNASTKLYTNGVLAVDDTAWGSSGNTQTTNSYWAGIGGVQIGNGLDGEIAEVLCYVPVLSQSNRIIVETYLTNKFGF